MLNPLRAICLMTVPTVLAMLLVPAPSDAKGGGHGGGGGRTAHTTGVKHGSLMGRGGRGGRGYDDGDNGYGGTAWGNTPWGTTSAVSRTSGHASAHATGGGSPEVQVQSYSWPKSSGAVNASAGEHSAMALGAKAVTGATPASHANPVDQLLKATSRP
jgi:hypothetical protein